jgi:hypothetical protein
LRNKGAAQSAPFTAIGECPIRETWYVLEDGSYADPREVSAGKKPGSLVGKSGVAVAMKGDVPSTRSVDPEEERAKKPAASKAKEATSPNNREMKADDSGPKYKTR